MTDKQMHQLLEKFINDHKLADNIKVEVSEHHKSFKPREPFLSANYEDCNLLASILLGAEHFLWWARRNGYNIGRKRQNRGVKTHNSTHSPRKGAKLCQKGH